MLTELYYLTDVELPQQHIRLQKQIILGYNLCIFQYISVVVASIWIEIKKSIILYNFMHLQLYSFIAL
jgi:hypothetical protein